MSRDQSRDHQSPLRAPCALALALLMSACGDEAPAKGEQAGARSAGAEGGAGAPRGGEAGEAGAGEPAGTPATPNDMSPYAPDDGPRHEGGRRVPVATPEELLSAIEGAAPGDVITLAPGDYPLNQLIRVTADGAAEAPIFVRAEALGQVTLSLSHLENFKLYGKRWVFENLRVVGACADAQGCEHAFHIVGDADDVLLRNNEVVDFASHVKLNGEPLSGGAVNSFPDRARFIGNYWHNTRYIYNDAPHNILNLDGGRGHVVRANIFADYSAPPTLPKSASAVYPKASARGVLIEQNLILCEHERLDGETARGVQLGDGAPASICDGDDDADGLGDCEARGQSQEALVRNNIILNCNNGGSAAGLMVGSDRGSQVLHNTVLNSSPRAAGFYIGHPDHDTLWRGNLLEGGVSASYAVRALREEDDLALTPEEAAALFVAPAEGDLSLAGGGEELLERRPTDPDAPHDFCGQPRGARADLGAIELSAPEGQACARRVLELIRQLR